MMTESSKPWYRSRTLWFNAVTAVLAGVELSFGVLQPVVSPEEYAAIVLGVTVVNLVLRSVTAQGLR